MISRFIWKNTSARISYAQLTRPKDLGGIALLDFGAYFSACQATHIVDWFLHLGTKDWIALEQMYTQTHDSLAPLCTDHESRFQ